MYPDAQAGHSPFYIGPLHGFAVGLNQKQNFHQAWYNMKGSNNTIAIAGTPFFEDMKLIVTIARLGLADWRLIYSSLRCHRFFFEGTVSLDRRFTKTLKFFDEAALRANLAAARIDEIQFWATHHSRNQVSMESEPRVVLRFLRRDGVMTQSFQQTSQLPLSDGRANGSQHEGGITKERVSRGQSYLPPGAFHNGRRTRTIQGHVWASHYTQRLDCRSRIDTQPAVSICRY